MGNEAKFPLYEMKMKLERFERAQEDLNKHCEKKNRKEPCKVRRVCSTCWNNPHVHVILCHEIYHEVCNGQTTRHSQK